MPSRLHPSSREDSKTLNPVFSYPRRHGNVGGWFSGIGRRGYSHIYQENLATKTAGLLEMVDKLYPETSSFFATLLSDFVKPLWQGVTSQAISQTAVLPEVCSFPILPIPHSFFAGQEVTEGYFIGKTYSGFWTIVDATLVRNPSSTSRAVPAVLLDLVFRLNSRAKTSPSAVVVFDEGSKKVVLVDLDWTSEKIVVVEMNDPKGYESTYQKEFSAVASGAACIAGIHFGNVVLSTGNDIHVISPDQSTWSLIDALAPPKVVRKLPISTQTVAPFIDKDGYVYYISSGSLWRGHKNGEKTLLHEQENVVYSSVVYHSKEQVLVIVGFDVREGLNVQYVTLFDIPGQFIASIDPIVNPLMTSIISTVIDTSSSEVFFVGRTSQYARYGSICYSVPAIYN
jgi:hypothetical protein